MEPFATLLAGRDVVLDGGLATELEARGHDLRDALWSARLLRDDPQAIEDVHVAYFEAGADVAITASYHATLRGIRGGRRGARRGRRPSAPQRRAGPARPRALRRLGARGREPRALRRRLRGRHRVHGRLPGRDGRPDRERRIAPGSRSSSAAGADLLAVETIPNGREAAILAELLDEVPGIEAWVTFCCRDGEHLSDGTPIGDAIRSAGRTGRVAAFGVNCTPPQHVESLLEAARRRPTCRSSSTRTRVASGTAIPSPGAASGRPLLARARLALARSRRAGDRRLLRHRPGRHRRADFAISFRAGSDVGL